MGFGFGGDNQLGVDNGPFRWGTGCAGLVGHHYTLGGLGGDYFTGFVNGEMRTVHHKTKLGRLK